MNTNLEQLYRQVIMDHYKNPRNKGLVKETGYKEIHYKNPSCGDDIKVQIKLDGDKIVDIKHEGTGCSICCSSASVMSETLKNTIISEANEKINNFFTMLKGEEINEEIDMGDAQAYVGVAQFPARIKCATLSWKAVEEGINE